MLKFLIGILLLVLSIQQNTIAVNPQFINQKATYTISLSMDTAVVPVGSYLIFQFDPLFYYPNHTNDASCINCSGATTLSLTFTGLTPVSNIITLVVNDIINPFASGSPLYVFTFYSSSTHQVLSTGSFTPKYFKFGNLQSCSINFYPNTTSTSGTMSINVLPLNSVLQSGKIIITLPNTWANAVSPTVISSLNCAAITNLNTGLTCSANSGSYIVITVNNAFSSRSTSAFSINISSIVSIPLSYSSSQTTLQTLSNNNNIIDSGICTISPPNPQSMTFSSSNTPIVGTSFNLSVLTTLTSRLSDSDKLTIVFPNIISVNFVTTSISISTQSAYCNGSTLSGFPLGSTFSQNSTYNNLRNLTFTISNIQSDIKGCTQSNMNIYGFPISIPSTASKTFIFYFSRQGFNYSSGTITISASSRALNSTSVSLSSNTTLINSKVIFTLSFVTSTYLNQGSKIQVVLPSKVSPYSPDISCSSGTLNGTPFSSICSLQSSTLIVQNINSPIHANTTVQFSFSGCSNPPSAQPVMFSINTKYSDGGTVDTLSSILYAANPGIILSASVNSSSYINGQSSNYTISYLSQNQYLSTSSILIGLPIGISMNSSSPICSYSLNGISISGINCSLTTSSGPDFNIEINISLNNIGIIPSGSNITLTLGLINNPITTQPSNSFSIFSYDSSNYLIESIKTGIIITMTTPNLFNYINVASSSGKNGELSTYTLSINPLTRQPSGSIMIITIPTEINVTNNYQCFNGSSQLTCIYSSPTLSITLSTQLTAGSIYTYNILNLINPRTFTTTSNFAIATRFSSYAVSRYDATGITNTIPNNIDTFTMTVTTPTQSYMNSTQTLRFFIRTTNFLSSTDYFTLTFPYQYKYIGTAGLTISCSPYSCTPSALNPLNVKVTSGSQQFTNINTFNFTINNYLSPNSSSSDNFQVSSFDVNNKPIDQINPSSSTAQTSFYTTCNLPCQMCSGGLSNCTSCYLSEIYSFSYYFSNNCYQTCPNITYVSGISCIACPPPCFTCSSSTVCTSCISGHFYITSNSTCTTQCPSRYYGDIVANQCKLCQSPCINCILSSTNCTSCIVPLLLEVNLCVTNCSDGYFNNSGKCTQCNISCSKCLGTSTNCTTCADGFYKSGNICVDTCPVSQTNINGICVNCSNSCYECTGSINNCSSCPVQRYLYRGSCVVNCPSSTTSINGICQDSGTASSVINSKLIPFPYIISSALICIICLLSKFSSSLTSIPVMGLSLNSIIEILSTVTILIISALSISNLNHSLFETSSLKNIGLAFIFAGVGIDLVLNISTIVYFCKHLQTDSNYVKWKKRSSNTSISRLCFIFGSVIYKFIYFQFSKAFGSLHLHATLLSPVKFFPITIITLIGVLPSICIVAGCALIALDSSTVILSAEYIQSIDCLIVKIVGIIFALASLKKSDDFFDETMRQNVGQDLNQDTLQGLNDLNDSYIMQHSVSHIGGKPIYQNQGDDGVSNKIKTKSSRYNDSNNKNDRSPAPIRQQQEQFDDADMGLDKKNTGRIDDKNYLKIGQNDQKVKNKEDFNNQNNNLFFPAEDQNEQILGSQQTLSNKINNSDQNLLLGNKDKTNTIEEQNKVKSKNNSKKNSKKSSPQKKSKTVSNQSPQNKSNNSNSPQKQNNNFMNSKGSPTLDKNKTSSDNIKNNNNLLDNDEFISEDDIGDKAMIKLNKDKNKNNNINSDDNNVGQLGEQINISKIQKKRSPGKDKIMQQSKLQQDKNKSNQKDFRKKSNDKEKDKNQKLKSLNSKEKLQKSPLNNGQYTPNNKEQNANDRSPYDILNKLQQSESKELDNDSQIVFEKAQNHEQECNDSLPQKTTAIRKQHKLSPNQIEVKKKDTDFEQSKTNKQKNSKTKGINNKDQIDDEQKNMENSNFMDSSVQMLEGLVKGMNGKQIKFDDKKIFNDNSELESANEGDFMFNQISPSEFNIQNQRFDDSMFELERQETHSSRELAMNSMRRVNFTQNIFPVSHSQTTIGLQNNVDIRPGSMIRGDQRQNIPTGIVRTYQSFDLAPIHQRGKSMKITSHGHHSHHHNHHQSLPRNERYQTTTPQDINKRNSRLRSLQKIYLQRLDMKNKDNPVHKRSSKYNL